MKMMNYEKRLFALFFSLMALVISFPLSAGEHNLHAPPLPLTLEQTQQLLKDFYEKGKDKDVGEAKFDKEVGNLILAGERFLKWVKLINHHHPQKKITLSDSSQKAKGHPLSSPLVYGPKSLKAFFDSLESSLSSYVYKTITSSAELSHAYPYNLARFIKDGKSLVRQYQLAVRWKAMVLPYLSYYQYRKAKDIRGYHYLRVLSQKKNLDELLLNFSQLEAPLKRKMREALTSICINHRNPMEHHLCASELNQIIHKEDGTLMLTFKNKYWVSAQNMWNSFFSIQNPRKDILWSQQTQHLLTIPFAEIKDQSLARWLEKNVEDEFKGNQWKLDIIYRPQAPHMAHLKFKPKVTPHVTNGNIITMDANTLLEDPHTKRTIRHEFGHILRLPDCYLEFYDEEKETMIYYELDTSNLMCSGAGFMKEEIFEELKKVYQGQNPEQ